MNLYKYPSHPRHLSEESARSWDMGNFVNFLFNGIPFYRTFAALFMPYTVCKHTSPCPASKLHTYILQYTFATITRSKSRSIYDEKKISNPGASIRNSWKTRATYTSDEWISRAHTTKASRLTDQRHRITYVTHPNNIT